MPKKSSSEVAEELRKFAKDREERERQEEARRTQESRYIGKRKGLLETGNGHSQNPEKKV